MWEFLIGVSYGALLWSGSAFVAVLGLAVWFWVTEPIHKRRRMARR